MVAKIPKRERLMNLVSALLAAQEPLPFREIMGRVIGYDDPGGEEALEKRFDRDKADLRELGIPIDYVTPEDGTKAGYVVRRDRVFQQKVTFTPQETVLLSIAGRVGSAATGGGALEEALKSALRKLAVDLADLDPLHDVGEISVLRARSGDPQALGNVQLLAHAVTTNRRVRFGYQGLRAEGPGVREVDPYGLGLLKGDWYLVGWCHLRGAIRVFKASRIEGAVALAGSEDQPVRFEVPPSFSLEEHLGREAWDFGDGASVTVRLRVAPQALAGHELQSARNLGVHDGWHVLEMEVRQPRALIPWVLSQGGDVQVQGPPGLREEVATEARRLLTAYGQALPSARRLEPQLLSEGEAP